MSAAHTPGPWSFEEGQCAITREWNSKTWVIASVEARLNWHEDLNCESREAGANARLIAAAPKLLLALKNLRNGIDLPHDSPSLGMLIDEADAAIAKATGATS